MAKKNNSSTMDITGFDIVNAAIDANGGGEAEEMKKQTEKVEKPAVKTKSAKTKKVTEVPSNLPELPKNFQDKFFDNIFSYDRSPDKGRPVYISSDILGKLQELSERHYKRLSVRTLVQSVMASFLSYNTDKAISDFLKKINFQVPTDEEQEKKKVAAEKARERRAAEKSNN